MTYGLKHVPHSAVSALQKCARDHEESHPAAAAIALQDYYMDDLSTGSDSSKEVIDLYHQMKSMMTAGGFSLRKWSSNDWNVITAFDTEDIPNTAPIEMRVDEVKSVLGTYWQPMTDEFMFKIGEMNGNQKITKRVATAEFDPTGLLAAVIARGKMMIQNLWLLKVGWDDELPEPEKGESLKYFNSLKQLEQIRIPRWIGSTKCTIIELHGFADASQHLYAATIYYRVKTADEFVQSAILTAKTR